jgi:WD40 repeat protein
MRFAIALGPLLLAINLLRADDKPEEGVQPIKVVEVARKEPLTYDKDIEPILLNKCNSCHSGSMKKGKFDISSYESVMKGGKKGVVVVPGKSMESRIALLAGRTTKPAMPPPGDEPLTPEELALIKLWIDQGAKAPTGMHQRPKVVLSLPPANVQPVRAVAVSADKSAVAAGRGNQIHVYDAGSGAYIRSLTDPNLTGPDGKPVAAAHLSIVESLAYSPDDKFLASGSFGEVALWDATSGMLRSKLTGFADRVVALSFSADGKLLATGGGVPTEEGEIKVFETDTGKLVVDIKNGHSDTVFGVSFSPDGTKLATCAADKFVKVFEVPSGKFLKSFEGHTHHVLDVGWKSDGKFLASAGADNVIKVWDYEKGEQARTIPGHGKQITRLLFIGTKPEIATCSGDQTVRFWNVDNGGNIRNFGGAANDYLYALGVSPDGSVVASGGEEGVVRLYNGTNGQLVKALLPPGVEAKK